MKKMTVTIIILFIIFISMVIYRSSEKKSEITIEEVKTIEDYIEKIYGWKEVTDTALPEFEDINDADEKWLWGTIRENIENFEIDYEQIEEVEKSLFGKSLTKKYPKEGNEFISYDKKMQKYKVNEITLDAVKDSYLMNKIEKDLTGYTIEIVEYLVDYTEIENGKVYIKNLKEEIIYELTEETATEGNIAKIVKENIDKFSKKKIVLEKEEERIVITSVSTC